ncbi:MAG: 6-pyruvoyl-tetrahydropterin synthase-related protein [Candidatus Levyibacteriota bacterium]
MKKRSNLIFLTIAVFLTLPALWGILHPGFFLSDDGNWMVIRLSAFYESIRDGQFPVRFLSRLNHGYGYPVADFLYPLFMYIGVPIHALGFSFVNTVKIILALSMIASSIFSFFWLRRLFDDISSLVGAVFYTYAPYHLFDLYKRGSVGEVLALSIIPFIFWQLERKSFIWSSAGIALLIVAHNTLAAMFLPLVILYMAFNILITKDKAKLIYQNTAAIILGFTLSAFFWIPAIYDLRYTVFSKTQVSDWSKYFSDFNLVGLTTAFIISLTLALILMKKIEIKKHRLTVLLLTVGIMSVFLSTSISSGLWELLPVSFVQFPFRFLSLAIFCIAFLAACVVSVLKRKVKVAGVFIILLITFISAWPFLFPKDYQYHEDSFYSTNQDSTTVKNEYMPKWVKNLPDSFDSKVEVLNGEEKINILEVNPNKISIEGYFPVQRTVQINTVYFPGWEVRIDGKQVPIDYNSNGLIRLDVPQGNHSIVSKFGETQIRLLADAISLVGVLIIVILFIKQHKKK